MSPANALPARTIEARNLACRRGERVLFERLEFSVPPGELLLLRGANGVGKTTLLLALAGLARPDAGTIDVRGRGEEDRPGSDLHFVGHQPAVKARLTVQENLAFWADLLGGRRELVAPALQTVGLERLAQLEAAHLSAGQIRRLALARLLAADRPVWLLDEPTASLDGEGEYLVAALLDTHLKRGGIAVAATHQDIRLPPPANVRSLTLGAT